MDLKKSKRKVTTLSLTIPYQVKDQLSNEMDRTGLTASEIIRRALDIYFTSGGVPR